MDGEHPDQVAPGLERLANLLRRYAEPALRGRRRYFAMLLRRRRAWERQWALDMHLHDVRSQAHEAFWQKDYARAARLYEQALLSLTPLERRKLNYARRHEHRERPQ